MGFRSLLSKGWRQLTFHLASPADAPFAQFIDEKLDREAYLEAYPDVRSTGLDPVRHWLEHGMAEGRSFFPHATFLHDSDPSQVKGAEWQHFTWHGKPLAVRLNASDAHFEEFVKRTLDREAYLNAYPEVRAAGLDPVRHWLEHGMAAGGSFFPDATVLVGDRAGQAKGSQWLHFTWNGNPVAFRLAVQPEDVPFLEYVKENLDRQDYLETYPAVRAAGLDPVKHWLEHGMADGLPLSPGAVVVFGDSVERIDKPHLWKRFTWRGKPIAVRAFTPIKQSLISQILAQARHDPAILASGALALDKLRQLDGPDLLMRGGVDIRSIFAAIPERPDVVVLISHLRVGAGDNRYTADLITAISALSQEKILVVVTLDPAETVQGWEAQITLAPFRVANVIFWRDIAGHNYKDPHLLARLFNVLRPSKIIVINSRVGLEMAANFGCGLSQFAKLYCAYFSLGNQGIGAPYGTRFPYRTLPFSVGLTDNEAMAATLRRQWGALPGPGIAVLPPRLQPADSLIFSTRLMARRHRTANASRTLRWLWVSRIEPFKGTRILAELARERPTDEFILFGPVEGTLSEMGLALPNVAYQGLLADVSCADFKEYDGFVFTSLFEGMPNTVLEMSQHAIPMVLADVGGLRDTFDDTSVRFVEHEQNIHLTAKAFANALQSIAELPPSDAVAMIKAAREQALARHAPDVYLKNVGELLTRTQV